MPQLTSRYCSALTFAAELHRDQCRKKTTIPYVAHLLAVSSLALEQGADEDEAIAALLHDAVEDQGGATTEATIRRLFGERVADIVVGCSDSKDGEQKKTWKERKTEYLGHLPAADGSIRLVSACDKLHNARSILADLRAHGSVVWARFSPSPEEILWYYRSLANEFSKEGPDHIASLADQFHRVVVELEEFAAQGRVQTAD